ncbi:hypothetical protein WG66_005702 [Moniliophthora roreri]|uniref:Chromo domain-containing protein n=1 Tax=Moniliophthora roreri TaxID=221103 RepID=A0A0W0FT14_MONRR|nr:hypothetical protein WG66_005702 [Moniliophthora roreri]
MSNLPHGQGRSIYSINPVPQNIRYSTQIPPQPQHQPAPRQQPQHSQIYNHAPLPHPHPHPHAVDPYFPVTQPTSTDLLVSRLMDKIAPILSQHQAYYTSRLNAIESSFHRALEPISQGVRQLETDVKGVKDQLESNKKELYELLDRSDKNQRRDMRSLADRLVKLEKTIGKGYELPGNEMTLTDKLDSISFTVDELVERYRDPGGATEPVIRHDVAIDTRSDAPMPPSIHHDMATSPFPEPVPRPERNPETSLKTLEPEPARYTDMGISPIRDKAQTQRFPRTPPSSTTPEPEPPELEIGEEAEEDASTTIYTATFSPVDWTRKDVFKRYQQLSIPPPPFPVFVGAIRINEEPESQVGGIQSATTTASASCEREPEPQEPEDDLFNSSPPSKKASTIDPQDDLNFDSAIASTPYPADKPVTMGSSSPIDFHMHVPSSRSPSPMVLPSQSQYLVPNATQDEEDFVAQMIGIPPPPTPAARQDTSPAPTSRAHTPTSRAHTYTSDVDDELSELSSLSSSETERSDDDDDDDDDEEAEPSAKRRKLANLSSLVKREQECLSTSTTPRKQSRLSKSSSAAPVSRRKAAREGRVKKEGETPASAGKKKRKHPEGSRKRIKWPEIVQDEAVMNTMIECDNPKCKCWFHIGCVGYRVDDPFINDEKWTFKCPACVVGRKLKPQFRGTDREESCARPQCPKHKQGQDNNEFFVWGIIGRRTKVESGKGKSYLWLVRWLNYPVNRATWETTDSLASGAQTLIEEFDSNVKKEGIKDDRHSVILLKEAVDGGWSVDEPDVVPRAC